MLGFAACSSDGSSVDTNETRLPAGTAGQLGITGSAGSGGLGGVGAGAGAGAANVAGTYGQAGLATSAGALNANSAGTGGAGAGGLTGFAGASFGGGGTGNAGNGGGAGSGAGAGSSAGAAGSSAAFTQVGMVLAKNCGIKGCHADKQAPHFVPDAMLYATLTGPNTVIASCGYTKLVEAGDPAKSALVRLMNRQCDGFTMPPSCNKTPCISTADLKTLSDWIQAGAPP
ncbi:MAG TPA: hypothetical protein VER11_06785 [Polyangiaceae bacterium]|nr:hypothetical protein [Polyangiaceae bacterium]